MNKILKETINFGYMLKTIQLKGNLVYEYNPFHNYRLSEMMFEYENSLYTYDELKNEKNIVLYKEVDGTLLPVIDVENFLLNEDSEVIWKLDDKVLSITESPQLKRAGEIVDFETNELHFNLNHPVNILPQYSYDNSVNLIINDGYNLPRLINSRFSATEHNKYLIIDRKGDNDTNLYDLGLEFDIDTSLYKKTKTIPELTYLGIFSSGNLSIGNYHFYFKYVDADGNESDFIGESGLVSVFIGDTPYNIHTGVRDENSHKGVSFILRNLDSGYLYISIYYTRSSADILLNRTTKACKIELKYLINSANVCLVKITGFEQVTEIPIELINLLYLIFNSVQTQEQCLNRLFFGNTSSQDLNYKELIDISLRFLPYYTTSPYNVNNIVSELYIPLKDYKNSYYDSKYIYNNVGYWPGELYRFGIVYILNDGSLTPVFNVRGVKEIPMYLEFNPTITQDYSDIKFKENGSRIYIKYNEETNLILSEDNSTRIELENCKGVVKFPESSDNSPNVYGIVFTLKDEEEIISALKDLNIKGYFFVRLKRIPTILCLALTIGVDKLSHTPIIPFKENEELEYISECFLNEESAKLTHSYDEHIYKINKFSTDMGAICPEYDVDYPYYNTLFSGDKFMVSKLRNVYLNRLPWNKRFYYEKLKDEDINNINLLQNTILIQAIEDNLKLTAIDDIMFSARAGEAEEVFRFEYAAVEDKTTEATNLIRGSYGPFLGLKDCTFDSSVINIYIPNYSTNNLQDYFLIRYNDKSSFYAIGDRLNIDSLRELKKVYYRGDCYICQFTHRINRNFQDPSSPFNDKIVDPDCWKDNWEMKDGIIVKENLDKINLGDVNAVLLGLWVTFILRSTKNLNIRTLDTSNVDEMNLFGNSRGFYPYTPLSTKGVYKIPEAMCYNKGFEKSLSERYNFEIPDVPSIKNDFTNRISYSDIVITDAFINGYRVFQGTHYRDYPKTYGSITKLVELRGNLLCIFEHGIALIPVNERAVAGKGSGGNVFINTSNVLPENPIIISDTFGSQWRESVIKTPVAVYGVDTIGKKIWRTNGQHFEIISDFNIQEFLNLNISLTERELLPVIGVRNVKTHYNKFKNDVMFTFYDNLYGFEEKVWNVCFNEALQKWITFYSWLPSYSENIYNQYFSFDRNTSKWITKLGISQSNNDFSDGITLDNVIIDNDNWNSDLHLKDKSSVKFQLIRDNYQNYKLFKITNRIDESGNTIYSLSLADGVTYDSLKSELYKRNEDGSVLTDERGIRMYLDKPINANKIVLLLNIKATIENGKTIIEEEHDSVIAVIPKYNMLFLTTDFWKHGQSGIIDISDPIAPTNWYGKQHPFEFEFVVADNPQLHKVFNNLQIISNKAAPESFHYEIVGECYDFAKDKENMYIRQEATKELYLYNGCDIVYNPDYKSLKSKPRLINESITDKYDKSTIFPLYYRRLDTINEIEDYYHLYGHKETYGNNDKNFSALAGAEIVRYPNLGEYRIWNHTKAVDIHDFKKGGRMRGNMQYKEDKWDVLINPINLVQRNETLNEWINVLGDGTKKMVPAECNLFNPPEELYMIDSEGNRVLNPVMLPSDWERNVIKWGNKVNKEVKLKDKFVKIRVRYSGKDLAVIYALKTLYSISYA